MNDRTRALGEAPGTRSIAGGIVILAAVTAAAAINARRQQRPHPPRI